MPNLRSSMIDSFWQKKDKRMHRILGWMESMEDWMLDDNEDVANSIYALANTLERVAEKDIVNNAEKLIEAMAYMSSPRALRLLEWFDEHFKQGGVSLKLTQKALSMKDNDRAALLLDRFNTLHRMSLLSKIFSPARTKVIVSLLQQHENSHNS